MFHAKAAATTVTTRGSSMSTENDVDVEKAQAKEPMDLARARTNDTVRDVAAVYEASPYDIDRVNTKNSVSGI
jgi:hypothetical protein